MNMLSILLAAARAGYFFFRPSILPVQRLRDFGRQITLVDFAVETVYSTG
jgi:hypothetical protein